MQWTSGTTAPKGRERNGRPPPAATGLWCGVATGKEYRSRSLCDKTWHFVIQNVSFARFALDTLLIDLAPVWCIILGVKRDADFENDI